MRKDDCRHCSIEGGVIFSIHVQKHRDEAWALAEPDTNKSRNGRVKEEWRPASDADEQRSDESMSEVCQRRLDLVERVESCILALVRTLLVPEIEATHNLIDYGATSLTAMMLLGKIRPALDGVLEGAEIRGLKLAVIKEVVGIDTICHGVCGAIPGLH